MRKHSSFLGSLVLVSVLALSTSVDARGHGGVYIGFGAPSIWVAPSYYPYYQTYYPYYQTYPYYRPYYYGPRYYPYYRHGHYYRHHRYYRRW